MTERRSEQWVLTLAMLLPTVITYFYFVHVRGDSTATQQAAYLAGKTAQFAIPLIWLRRLPARRQGARGSDWLLGVGFGVAVMLLVLGTYFAVVRQSPLAERLVAAAQQKISGLSLATPWRYLGLTLAYSLVHSWLEEYYWRWFVYGRLRDHVGCPWAILLSSVSFMLHHVVVLTALLGWDSPWTYVFCAGVAAGGGFWAWLYERSRCLSPAWISHALVDAAIFGIGYLLVAPLWETAP